MEALEFYDQVAAHPELEWLGVREGDSPERDEVLVCHTVSGLKHATAVHAVLEHPWAELEAVLTGRRQALIMTHLTRIVGYFSRVQNWNRSKLAELRDRHAGSYAVEEAGPPTAPTPSRGRELAAAAL